MLSLHDICKQLATNHSVPYTSINQPINQSIQSIRIALIAELTVEAGSYFSQTILLRQSPDQILHQVWEKNEARKQITIIQQRLSEI